MRCGADYGSIFSSSSSGCCNESVRRLRLALRCIGSFQFTPRVPAPARKVQLAPRQTRWRRREWVADPAESAMCRLGKIVLGFAALILPSLKCSRRSRNQSAKSAKRRELREGSQVARLPGPAWRQQAAAVPLERRLKRALSADVWHVLTIWQLNTCGVAPVSSLNYCFYASKQYQ